MRRTTPPTFITSAVLLFLSLCNFFRTHPSLLSLTFSSTSSLPLLSSISLPYPSGEESTSSSTHWVQQYLRRKLKSATGAPERILYSVTSLNEYDNGLRSTTKGYDRFSKTIVPLLVESIGSMIEAGFSVDLYFICHYNLTSARQDELHARLPKSVTLFVWDDATPLSYPKNNESEQKKNQKNGGIREAFDRIQPITNGLARQHRYVIKDKLLDYDIFVNFEDDMLVKGAHVQHFVDVSEELYRLRQDAPYDFNPPLSVEESHQMFYGEMTKAQLQRTIPGFIRVEAALNGFQVPDKDKRHTQIPVSHDWNETHDDLHIDPSYCCHVSNDTANDRMPPAPPRHEIYFWETQIDSLGVRKLPDHASWDWVLLQAGNNNQFDAPVIIGDYWAGRGEAKYFGHNATRPNRILGKFSNNQGGWMASTKQILEMHTKICFTGFLPPFDQERLLAKDGLYGTVEYWSGGISIWGPAACGMQRIITMDPDGFSKHLLYHSSNNKQRAMRHKFPGQTIDEFWGQLNTIRKHAQEHMESNLAQGAASKR